MRLEDLKNRNYKVSAKPNPARSFKRPRSSNSDSDSDSHPVRVLGQQTKRSVKRQRLMPKAKDIDEEDNGGLAPLMAVVDHGVAVSNSEVSSSNFSSCKSPVTVLHHPRYHSSPVNPTTSYEMNLSPPRAARVAMLKARFAGTIFKAKQDVLYSGSNGLENTEDEIKKFRAAEILKANEYIKEQGQ